MFLCMCVASYCPKFKHCKRSISINNKVEPNQHNYANLSEECNELEGYSQFIKGDK